MRLQALGVASDQAAVVRGGSGSGGREPVASGVESQCLLTTARFPVSRSFSQRKLIPNTSLSPWGLEGK